MPTRFPPGDPFFAEMQTTLNKPQRASPLTNLCCRAQYGFCGSPWRKSGAGWASSGRNIPSFEIFTSPDWRGTSGSIFFDLPLYRYGNIIKDISARICERENRVGKGREERKAPPPDDRAEERGQDREFSLTDTQLSQKITRSWAEHPVRRNYGGKFATGTLAVGNVVSRHLCRQTTSKISEKEFEKLGSIIHRNIRTSSLLLTGPLRSDEKWRRKGDYGKGALCTMTL